ncbi:MAG: hypothetical protein IGS23_14065 [Rivularia sp. T60_A2020_040]|nr:hypothetical protein [Rivularia sp. T60_A2020_040]
MHSINLVKSINLQLDVNTGDNIIPFMLSEVEIDINLRHKILSQNKYLKNLKCYSAIKSIAEAELPNFNFDDSQSDKLNKVLDIEWKSPRKQLNLLIGNENNWMPIGETSLLNPMGYPYRINNLLDLLTDNLAFELGQDTQLAVKIEDVGYGLLEDTDLITIYGNYVEEIVIDDSVQPITSVIDKTVNIAANSNVVAISNSNRKYCLIQNNSNNEIYVSLSNQASISSIKILPNGHYDFNVNNVAYFGEVSVYSDYNSSVLIVECS